MKEACLIFPGIGSVPPAFLNPFDFVGHSIATNYYDIPHSVELWAGHNSTEFQYQTESTTGDDIAFVDGGKVMWRFGPLNLGPQDNNRFLVPGGQDPNRKCPTSLTNLLRHESVPYIKLSKLHSSLPLQRHH
jgi:hypothetical protein